MKTELLLANPSDAACDAIDRAVVTLQGGEVVALPTETVYGLAADALNPDAVLKIFEAKERPFFDPLIVHLPDRNWLERVARIEVALVEKLANRFWPGPLTLVLPRREMIPDVVAAGLGTVAVRMSAHPVFRAVGAKLGSPLAAPSANRFGRISPTSAPDVMSELNGRIPLILDGGNCAVGLESTIVRVEPEKLSILRAGPVTPEELREFAPVEFGVSVLEKPNAPGQLKSHYAPRTAMMLVGDVRCTQPRSGERVGFLGWKSAPSDGGYAAVEILSQQEDLREAATTLFAKMRALDAAGLERIVAEPVPEVGLGLAIMDRLRKAAAKDESV